MKAAEWRRLVRIHLDSQLPPHEAVRNMVLLLPIDQVLRGMSAESSAFGSEALWIHVFAMPLYVPSTYIYFRFGDRLGALGGKAERSWNVSRENESEVMREVLELTKSEGLPFLDEFQRPVDVAEYIDLKVHRDTYRLDSNLAEIEAYSWILGGQSERALAAFDRLEQIKKGKSDASTEKVLARARKVRALLQRSPAEAMAQLAEWRLFTLSALRLDRWS
jgi:hypothetical protein